MLLIIYTDILPGKGLRVRGIPPVEEMGSGWGNPPVGRDRVVGTLGVILTIQTFFKAKNNIL